MLRVLAQTPNLGPVASIDDLRSQAVLLELQDFARHNTSVLEGRLQTLVEEDKRRGSAYVATLRAYLEHFGDIPAAAASASLQPAGRSVAHQLHEQGSPLHLTFAFVR